MSYAEDRRNVYGENDKASRRNLPKKRRATRAYRRRANATSIDAVIADREVVIEPHLGPGSSRAGGVKSPDRPLGEVVIEQIMRQVRLAIDEPENAIAKIERIECALRNT